MKPYNGPGKVHWQWPTGSGGGTIQGNGVAFTPRPGERFVRASVTDDVVAKVGGYVRQDRSKHGPEVFEPFCGSTPRDVRITPKRDVWIYVSTTPCKQSDGVPISGEISLTFTSR